MVEQGTDGRIAADAATGLSALRAEPASGLGASHSDPIAQETRFQRITREQAERQAAREARAQAAQRKPRRQRYTAEQRNADRIDGYDRDDLGLSPDF